MSASLNDRPNRVEVSGDAATVTAGAGVQGAQGEPGIIISATEPTETDVLWADTSAAGSMVVPAGGSTGQVLAKASASDYDSEWITPSSGGIPATIIDAAGDLIVGTAADTVARLAVGSVRGQRLVVDSTTASGMAWQSDPLDNGLMLPSYWQCPPSGAATTGQGTVAANAVYAYPFSVSTARTIEGLGAYVATNIAASSFEVAVYDNQTGDYPSNRLVRSGLLSSATTGWKEATGLSYLLPPGFYWLAIASDAAIALRTMTLFRAWLGFDQVNINRSTVGRNRTSVWSSGLPASFNSSSWGNQSTTANLVTGFMRFA